MKEFLVQQVREGASTILFETKSFEQAMEYIEVEKTLNHSDCYYEITDKNDYNAVFYTTKHTYREQLEKSKKSSVYFDLDGTMCYWYRDGLGLSYPDEILDPRNHYYRNLEPHEFTVTLAKQLQEQGIDVCIISAADLGAIHDKLYWVEQYCPFIPKENIFFCPIGTDKTRYIKGNAKYSVLVDDYNPNLDDWKEAGGMPVKLINFINNLNPAYDCLDAANYESGDETERAAIMEESLWVVKHLLKAQKEKGKDYE